MKIKIAYHKPGTDKIEKITTVEAEFVHTRGISIDTITTSVLGIITIFPTTRPGRIDQQGDTVYLIGKEFADEHPEPYQLHDNIKLFGEAVTVC